MPEIQPMNKPDLYVVARILERLWREESPMLKTHLQLASRVNYDVFTKYLGWMIERDLVGLVASDDGHERVLLTTKGEESYKRLVQWMNEVIHGKMPS